VVEIELENLTDTDLSVVLEDQVPVSGYEDLAITWRASPAPDRGNIDKKRRVLAWDVPLEAGSLRSIRLEAELTWPDGMELR